MAACAVKMVPRSPAAAPSGRRGDARRSSAALHRLLAPGSATSRVERGIEIADHLVRQVDRGRHVDRLDVDLQQRPVADPGLVLDLDGVVAEADHQIGRAQELALDLPAGALDAAERERVILVDHALGHGGGGERQVVPLDERRSSDGSCMRMALAPITATGRLAAAMQLAGARERRGRCGPRARAGRRRRPARPRARWRAPRPPAGRDAPAPAARSGRAPAPASASRRSMPPCEPQRRLGDRLEQRVMVDPHLQAAAELRGDELAGDRDHRRAVEEGAADAGGEVGGAGAERGDAEARARRSCGR